MDVEAGIKGRLSDRHVTEASDARARPFGFVWRAMDRFA